MKRFDIDLAAISSAWTSGMPPPSSVASVRAACDVANFRAADPSHGIRSTALSIRSRWPGRCDQVTSATAPPTTRSSSSQMFCGDDVRDAR